MHPNRLAVLIASCLLSPALSAAEPVILVEGSPLLRAETLYEPDEIHLSPTGDAGEALRNLPGVSGTRLGGRGIDPIIRGQSQNRLNILVDGAYVHGGCPNRMDPPTAYNGVDKFENITVIKGSQSVIYGGGGSGGTVLLERDKPEFEPNKAWQGAFAAGYRDNSDSLETSIDLAVGSEDAYLRGMATFNDADNYEDGDGNSVSSAFQGQEGSIIAGATLGEATELEVSYTANRERDILFAGAGMDSPYTDNDMLQLKLRHNAPIGPFQALSVDLYNSEVEHLMDNYTLRKKGNPMMFLRAPSTSDTVGGRVIATLQHTAHTWKIGVDYQDNERNADRFAGMSAAAADAATTPQSILWPDATLEQVGLFAEMSRPLNEQQRLSAGLRYDRVKASISEADDATAMMGPTPRGLYNTYYDATASTSTTEHNIGGFVRLEHQLSDASLIYGSLSRSVRTADATERYIASRSSMGNWVGNTRIDPEQHHQLEVGYQRQQPSWDFDIAVFYNDVTDFILRDRAAGQDGIAQADGASIYRNVDARLVGFETGLNLRWSDHWSSLVTLAYVHAENTSDDRAIAQTPPLETTLSLEYNADDWRVGGLIRAQAEQTRDDTASGQDVGETDGWATLDLYGSLHVGDSITLSAGVNNLFDETYAYHVNRSSSASTDPFNPLATQVNEPGREFWMKMRADF